jgi:hypothetical protein
MVRLLSIAMASSSSGLIDVLAFTDLVALDDIWGIDLFSGFRIHLAVSDAVAGLFIDLIEADFFSLADRGE